MTNERDLLNVVLEDAELIRYDHGGARLCLKKPDGGRELIADFYGDGEWREFFMDLVKQAARQATPSAQLLSRAQRVLAHDFAEECQECAIGHSDEWAELKAAVNEQTEKNAKLTCKQDGACRSQSSVRMMCWPCQVRWHRKTADEIENCLRADEKPPRVEPRGDM